ncbi:pickpocket 28 [Carabus blaptoides fortunei]
MTRTFIEAISVSARKASTEKATSLSSGRRLIVAMFKANHGIVRPRRNSSAWAIAKRANRADKMTISNAMQEYTINTEYNQHYIPIRGPGIKQPVNEKERVAEKLRTSGWSILTYLRDYCEGTTLHGLRYVGIKGASIFERIFWILAFIGAIGFSAFFISNIYDKWVYTPVIVGINPQFKSITEIPFPALTICNMNQAGKVVAEQVMAGNNEAEKELLEDICNVNGTQIESNSTDSSSSDWEFIKTFMLKVSQPCNKLFVHCKWQGYSVPCEHIINEALTDEGVCCTFNKVANQYMYHNPWILADFNIQFPDNNIDWTPEYGYPANSTNDTWPYRAAGPGVHLGLSLVVNVAADDYYCSSTNSVGLKIRLHSPVEAPMMADYGFLIHPRKEVRIAVRPTMDEASPTINSIPIDRRQCYFSEEKQLYFYRTYTKMNCDLECLSNYTVAKCGCVPFYLPKNINTSICAKRNEYCYRKAKTDMDLYHPPAIIRWGIYHDLNYVVQKQTLQLCLV